MIGETMTEHKDVMLAAVGASAGIAGLTLVFLGLVVTGIRAFQPGTSRSVLARYRRPAVTVLVAFSTSLVATVLAASWLVALGDVHWLYVLAVIAFFLQLVVLAVAVTHVLRRILWEG
jgi:hypothetical protein